MSAAVLDSHPTLTAVLFGLYEQEPGVFMPISFEDRLTAVQILADRLDPPAPDPRVGAIVTADRYYKTIIAMLNEAYSVEYPEASCHSAPPSPGPSPTAESTSAPSNPPEPRK